MPIKRKKTALIFLMLLSLVSAPLAGVAGPQGTDASMGALAGMDHENCVCQHSDSGTHKQHTSHTGNNCGDSDHDGCSNCLQCGHCQHASTFLLKQAPVPTQRARQFPAANIASLITVSGSPDYRPPRLI